MLCAGLLLVGPQVLRYLGIAILAFWNTTAHSLAVEASLSNERTNEGMIEGRRLTIQAVRCFFIRGR